jgi:two-component system sensor histidine kinase/response regulator
VVVVDNGAKAVEAVGREAFDLVLMDCQMPEMDGFAATGRIREIEAAAAATRLPIVALTAHALKGDREACLAAGMDDHVAKPVDPAALFATLLRWLPEPGAAAKTPVAPAHGREPLAARLRAVVGLDVSQGLHHAGSRADLYERVLRRFVDMHRSGDAAVTLPRDTVDAARCRAALHSLRGACATIGAADLARAAATLEARFEEPANAAELQPRIAALADELAALVRRLGEALGH